MRARERIFCSIPLLIHCRSCLPSFHPLLCFLLITYACDSPTTIVDTRFHVSIKNTNMRTFSTIFHTDLWSAPASVSHPCLLTPCRKPVSSSSWTSHFPFARSCHFVDLMRQRVSCMVRHASIVTRNSQRSQRHPEIAHRRGRAEEGVGANASHFSITYPYDGPSHSIHQ